MSSVRNNELSLPQAFFIAAAFTSSFDIFLVLNFGFNFRIAQLFLLIPIGLVAVRAIGHKVILPLGTGWLLLWTISIFIFLPNTSFPERSLGYFAWLLISVLTIFVCVHLFSNSSAILVLARWYVYSFVFVAIFGLLQFVSPIIGFGDLLLIQQWWIPGILPRINGFSYEPSFFATYLIMGWVVCAHLVEAKSSLFVDTHLKIYFLLITLSLILSSSRMGLLMMMLWYVQYPFRFVVRLIGGHFNMRFAKITLISFAVVLLLVATMLYFFGFSELVFLFEGLGIFGGVAHSVDTRNNSTRDTFLIFMNSPIIGYSLGGVAPAIANLHGVTNLNFETIKEFEGNSVFVEVLAASGLFGFIPFAMFIFYMVRKPLHLARKVSSEQSSILVALTLALIFELMILQFNQNILRPYLWMHIAILAACYSAYKRSRNVVGVARDRI